MDEAPSPVEWIFDKARPDLGSRLSFNVGKAAVVTGGDTNKRPSSGAVPKPKRQRTGPNSQTTTIDTLKLVAGDVVSATVPGSSRPTTFADMLVHSAAFVVATADAEFSNAASTSMTLRID